MGGAYIWAIGETRKEVKGKLAEAEQEANALGLLDLREKVVEPNFLYFDEDGVEKTAPWGGAIHVHS